MSYNNPIPVAVCLVRVRTDNDLRTFDNGDPTQRDTGTMLLAGVRGIEPQIGGLAFPGGYIDANETAEEAAARELFEEMNIITKPENWRPLMTLMTPFNRLLIFMRCIPTFEPEKSIGLFVPNHEVLAAELVDVGDTLCFPTHQRVLDSKLIWY